MNQKERDMLAAVVSVAIIGVLVMMITGCAPSLLTYDPNGDGNGEECSKAVPFGEEREAWEAAYPDEPFPGRYGKSMTDLRYRLIKACFAKYDMAEYRDRMYGHSGGGYGGPFAVIVVPSSSPIFRP